MRVTKPKAFHLAADHGAVNFIEIHQGNDTVISCLHPVFLNEDLSKASFTVKIEVHEEKGYVGRRIRVTKPGVKLDTVENADSVIKADVLGMNVPIAVPDEPITYP